jgi:HPt (histidine-containing phosphotransfer) domain-containing protein
MADDVVLVDVAEGSKRVMNNTKLYVKLLGKFKDDPNMKDLEAALAAGDMEKAKTSVHTLKGLSANLSLTEMFKQSLELETQIKAGSVNPNQVTVLKDIVDRTLKEIDKVVAQYG